jgi:hypothetical protein
MTKKNHRNCKTSSRDQWRHTTSYAILKRRFSLIEGPTVGICRSSYKLPLKFKETNCLRIKKNQPKITSNHKSDDCVGKLLHLDKYSVTIDNFGGWITAPIRSTMFGWRRRFMSVTYEINWDTEVKSMRTKKWICENII